MQVCTTPRHGQSIADCDSCRQPFCPLCLVTFQGRLLCARCKDREVGKLTDRRRGSILCYLSLVVSLPSLLFICFALACGPASIILGLLGLYQVERDSHLQGRAWAWSGIILGSYGLVLSMTFWLRFIVFRG